MRVLSRYTNTYQQSAASYWDKIKFKKKLHGIRRVTVFVNNKSSIHFLDPVLYIHIHLERERENIYILDTRTMKFNAYHD